MDDVYKIGVTLALKGGIGPTVDKLIEQFTQLDKAINRSQHSLNALVDGMRTLNREARGAADSMKGAADAFERAARAGRQTGGMGGGRAGARDRGAGNGPLGGPLMPYGEQQWRNPYEPGPASAPKMIGYQPYIYENGEVFPPDRTGGPGGPLAFRGPVIDGTAERPGYKSYPYPYGGAGGGGGAAPPGGGEDEGGEPGSGRGGKRRGLHAHDGIAQGLAALTGGEFLKSTIVTGADVQNLIAGLRAQGFDPNQAQQAYKEAFTIQGNVRGSDVMGNLRLLADLKATTQSAAESLELLPMFAKLQVDLGRFGRSGESELVASIKGAEEKGAIGKVDPQTGKFVLDKKSLTDYLNAQLAAVAITRGQVDPAMLLQFQRSLNWVAPNLSNEQLIARNLAAIQAMGASRAGRGLFALEQQWGAGQMAQAAADMAINFGLIQGGGTAKTNPNIKAKGFGTYVVMPQGWAPGVSDMLRTDPQGFALKYLLPHLDGYLQKNIPGFDKLSAPQKAFEEIKLGSAISSRDPARAYFGQLIQLRGLIERDQQAWLAAMQRPLDTLLTQGNGQVDIQALTASIQALQIAISGPAMQQAIGAMNGITGSLNGLGNWANDHATATAYGMSALEGAVIGLGAGAGLAALVALGGPGGAIAAIGLGVGLALPALKDFSSYLAKAFPSTFGPEATKRIQHSVAPLYSDSPIPGGDPSVFGAPHRPSAPIVGSGGAPVAVHVVGGNVNAHVANPADLTSGIASALARNSYDPPTGVTGHDFRIDPMTVWSGNFGNP